RSAGRPLVLEQPAPAAQPQRLQGHGRISPPHGYSSVPMSRWLAMPTLVIAWLALSCSGAAADSAPSSHMVVVAPDGSGAYREIQAAIDDAKRGDTIVIKAGPQRNGVV